MPNWTVLAVILWIIIPNVIHAKLVEGQLQTLEDWAFLARFCFLSSRGRLQFEIEYPQQDYEPQNLLLYFDTEDQWPAVYKSDKNCTQRESPPHIKPENNQKIILDENQFWSGCEHVGSNVTKLITVQCKAGRSFRSSRERWWFIAASRCVPKNNVVGLNMKYKMYLYNGEEGDLFFKHFSADEFYILQVDIAFLVIMVTMFCVSIYIAFVLRGRQLFHTTYKLYMLSLILEVAYLLMMCITFGKYANDGLENYGMKTFSRVLESVSLLVFLLMLILMAKGFTITRGRISTSGSIKIAVFMTLYTITYAVLFIYEAEYFDPGQVLYLYESPPGYGLIGMRLLGWIWFCYATFFTLKHYPDKSLFYYPFFIFYTIWFWAAPIMILVAMFAMPLWTREKAVNGVKIVIEFLGYIFILILTRPSAANKNFPYHVRTSQIGVMNTGKQNGIPMGASAESDSFGTHAYAPSSENGQAGPNFSELFTVSNTHSQPNGSTNLDAFPHTRPESNPFVTTH